MPTETKIHPALLPLVDLCARDPEAAAWALWRGGHEDSTEAPEAARAACIEAAARIVEALPNPDPKLAEWVMWDAAYRGDPAKRRERWERRLAVVRSQGQEPGDAAAYFALWLHEQGEHAAALYPLIEWAEWFIRDGGGFPSSIGAEDHWKFIRAAKDAGAPKALVRRAEALARKVEHEDKRRGDAIRARFERKAVRA
ncbi:MAG: hypothetical protein HS116_19020 [Planctomycetes bacterium]|nr:hypothetical protein [Planctomycetota bacterium]